MNVTKALPDERMVRRIRIAAEGARWRVINIPAQSASLPNLKRIQKSNVTCWPTA